MDECLPGPSTPSTLKRTKLDGGSSEHQSWKRQRRFANNSFSDSRLFLPVTQCKNEILAEVRKNPTVICISETGSGKSTQIPQFLYEADLHHKKLIVVTQPRRVAAVTLAQRVAEEMESELGTLVGYKVRFDSCVSDQTKIAFMTDGMLLREAMTDPYLRRYSIVILDEAHERSVRTDVLFGVVKEAQRIRSQQDGFGKLKIIIMSATMNVDHFSRYFNNAPVLFVEGRQHPVEIFFAAEKQSDYVYSAIVSIFQLHKEEPPDRGFLVFLTGADEIEAAVRRCRSLCKELPSDLPKMEIYALYAAMPPQMQMRVFGEPPEGVRKVILATNVAETSLTIRGISSGVVIDSGRVKEKIFNAKSRLEILKIQTISKSQAVQRAGRAGRERPGKCFRLFTETDMNNFSDETLPEIVRLNLSNVILEMLTMGAKHVLTFDFMDRPPAESISEAKRELRLLGAIEGDEGSMKLTEIGRLMAAFPLEPKLSRIIIAATQKFGCGIEALSVVSLISSDQSIFISPNQKRDESLAAHQKFFAPEGDHLTFLNVFRGFKNANKNRQWCSENFLQSRQLEMALKIRNQLKEICEEHNLPLESCKGNLDLVRQALCAGLFLNSAALQEDGKFQTIDSMAVAQIHPSSCLFRAKPGFLIFTQILFTSKTFLRDITVVAPEWLAAAAPDYFKEKRLNF